MVFGSSHSSTLHVWATKFKPLLMLFKLLVLASNNIVWVSLFAVLFDEAQRVLKTAVAGYVPVFYEIINLFIKPQNFLLMFFICKLKGFFCQFVCQGLSWLVNVLLGSL